jgi:hypothetical protein
MLQNIINNVSLGIKSRFMLNISTTAATIGVLLATIAVIGAIDGASASVTGEANPYCDLVPDDFSGDCHDRFDFYEGGPNNGLFPCNDGSARSAPRDCPDVSGFDYNGNSNDSDEDGGGDEEDGGGDEEEEVLPQDGGCQGEDDFCDADEGCRSDSVDCIDDRNFDEDDYNG